MSSRMRFWQHYFPAIRLDRIRAEIAGAHLPLRSIAGAGPVRIFVLADLTAGCVVLHFTDAAAGAIVHVAPLRRRQADSVAARQRSGDLVGAANLLLCIGSA